MKHLMFKDWTEKRVRKIISIFGKDWFHHKKILELGACHGDVGLEFLKLGADVLFTDARGSNLKILHDKLNEINFSPKTKIIDQNKEYKLNEQYNLVLHLGVLYHVKNWKKDLENCLKHTNKLILESLVHPVKSLKSTTENSFIYKYNSIDGVEPIFTQESVEKHLLKLGCKFLRLDTSDLNTDWSWMNENRRVRKIYDWTYESVNSYIFDQNDSTQFRRMWVVLK
tara:strand:- start:226 stop:903 length:678 start_codon:yes stop_codon:yes gene_type:complete